MGERTPADDQHGLGPLGLPKRKVTVQVNQRIQSRALFRQITAQNGSGPPYLQGLAKSWSVVIDDNGLRSLIQRPLINSVQVNLAQIWIIKASKKSTPMVKGGFGIKTIRSTPAD